MLQGFQDQNHSTLTHYESIPVAIERARGMLWIIGATREYSQHAEANQTHGGEQGGGAAGEHQVSVPQPHEPYCFAHRLSP